MANVTEDFLKKHQSSADENDNADVSNVIPPTLYRIYKATVQRQAPTYRSLSSHAAFLILLDSESQVLGWVGSQCSEEDVQLLQELGIDVMTRDYSHPNVKTIPIVYEQDDPNALLEALLDIFEIDGSIYSNKLTATERRKTIENSSVSIGLIIPPKNLRDFNLFELKETSYAHPDLNGMVPRIPFPHLEKNSIVYMNIGDQWDLWFAKGCKQNVIDLAIKFIENLIETQLSRTIGVGFNGNDHGIKSPNSAADANATLKALVLQYLQITNQGEERQCFRHPLKIFTDFEPFDNVETILAHRQEQFDQEAKKNGDFEHRPQDNLQIRRDVNELNRNQGSEPDMSPVIARDNTNFWANNGSPSKLNNFTSPANANKSGNPLYGDSNTPKNFFSDRPTIQVNDADAITPALLQLEEAANIPLQQRRAVIEESINNPDVLLGWQVNTSSFISVVNIVSFPPWFVSLG